MSQASQYQAVSHTVRTKETRNDIEQDSINELDSVSLTELLDLDPRPTFVLDLDSDYLDSRGSKDEVHPLFCNAALRLHDRLLDRVTGTVMDESLEGPDTKTYQEFRSWATSVSTFDDSRDVFPLTLLYSGMLWTGSTIRQRWRIISGNQCYQVSNVPKGDLFSGFPGELAATQANSKDKATQVGLGSPNTSNASFQTPRTHTSDFTPPTPSKTTNQISLEEHILEVGGAKVSDGSSNDTSGSSTSVTLAAPKQGVPDWTAPNPKGILSPHAIFARNIDWVATPLGPMKDWSPEFREVTNLVMRNPHPATLFWGEDLTMLYNDAYKTEVAGNKHPALMGTGISGPFAELWDNVGPFFRECARTGKSVRRENDPLPLERYGYLEETFFSWSLTPLYGGTRRILGFYNAPFETTYQTINSRRMQTLRHLGEKVAPARGVKHFWKGVLDGLEDNPFDVPFALLYSIADSDGTDTSSHSSESTISLKSCLFEGSIGIPDGHPAAPPKLDLKRSKEGFIPSFREAMRTREPTVLQARDGTLPEGLLEGIQWRGFEEPCREVIIVPIRPTNGENIFAFLLIGINPRRAYDEDYQSFATMLNRQLATSLASALLFEDELRRSRNAVEAAAVQREQLTQQFEVQKSRLRRMTEFSPLGMYLFSPDAVLLEANDRYYEMSGHPRDGAYEMSFLETVAEGSRKTCTDMWLNMIADHKPRTEELQLKIRDFQPRDLAGEPIEYWVLASSQPEIGLDGELRSVMGSIADISHIKWAQGLQDRALREAQETKRQQNEFIDMTSHEMRNPLSAILICADDIRDSLSEHFSSEKDAMVIANCIEAANTIALCVQHQKAIVDDILTISKLDSNLLLITPVSIQPIAVVKRAMSMFKPEVQAKEITFEFVAHPSLQELDIDWLNLDPSRLLQITVNLITNAIKFTASSPRRVISVHMGASVSQVVVQTNGFKYIPTRNQTVNVTTTEDWGTGELLYLRVKVADTGCGLTEEEMNSLFERFAQASPRTHAHYGGSGLGLFISRQLAELHGGQIGVASEAGVGSTFGFFIQARRVSAPPSTEKPFSRIGPTSKGDLSPVTAIAMPSTNPGISESKRPIRIDPKQMHILIVEDNIVNQKVLKKQLAKAGCTVSTADNGILALDFLETTAFRKEGGTPLSVILMDLEMPEMDGLTCARCIRKMEAEGAIANHVPIIAVTANVRGEQIATARDSGMNDVVSKPFRISELLTKIDVLLNKLAGGQS